jgi:HEAT repeat protein
MVKNIWELNDQSAVDLFIKALRKGDKLTRSFAAELLGEIGDERAILPLKSALEDKEDIVRIYAERSLDKLTRKVA